MVRPLLIVFAKAPEAGLVKSRLASAIGEDVAARLHEAMVTDLMCRLGVLRSEIDVELHTDKPTASWPAVPQRLQSGGDLGQRMLTAIACAHEAGRPIVLLAGSDSPTLPLAHLRNLLSLPADVSLGPASDGGFYAISCRRMHPAMFEDVVWSCADTREQTVRAIRRTGLTVGLGPEWYDVDVPADLDRLARDPDVGPATRAVLVAAGLAR
jgi:rSAM/selenodomain-associated transferase 1